MTAQIACVDPLKNSTSHGSFASLGGQWDLMNIRAPSNKASETVLAHLSIRAVDTGLSQSLGLSILRVSFIKILSLMLNSDAIPGCRFHFRFLGEFSCCASQSWADPCQPWWDQEYRISPFSFWRYWTLGECSSDLPLAPTCSWKDPGLRHTQSTYGFI